MKTSVCHQPASQAGTKRVEFEFESRPLHCISHCGKPWFIAAHVCAILGLSNITEALRGIDEDEKMTLRIAEGHSGKRGGARSLNLINESALYSLIFKSRKPKAKAFKKWVTSEVLPSIRETGRYETGIGSATNEAGAVAWVLGQIARTMPWAKVLELILPLHAYGSLAANSQPRTGFRRPAFVAAPHRTAAATDFHEHTVMVKLLARQQELPFREGGTRE